MEYVTEYYTVKDTKIRLLKGGSGAPLLFLHGANGAGDWLPILKTLSQDYTVYYPDHPGYGESDTHPKIDSVQDLAFFYLDVMDHLDIDKAVVMGSSLGGWLAVEMALIAPEKIDKLILIDAAGIRIENVKIPDIFVMSPQQVYNILFHSEEAKNDYASKNINSPDLENIVLRNRIATSHLAWNPYFHNPKILDRIHRLKMPILVVWGAEDKFFPVAYGERYHELISHSALQIIKDAGHFPHIEQPEQFWNSIKYFLAEEEAAHEVL
ncbi:alpha/beta hydrolase [Peribacillus cavernae]|uniref:Alpha/beta hydrolase n=1 Tax=Peribacillus cavernae TaxID=1674310 RepID=A0A3S0VQZ9_9BACI|nr:alpha/beta hydrolase [Peribacillus cavernae]MDQ0218643.1 pimeloyl-ACP methyl ester carboxylesterase [Peribacillus cavernae]RUQ30871.1 alpha/beta hydrolase [Peribacillus cavernae]